jgi:competence protein ComFC
MAVKMGVPCTTCAPFTAIDRLLIASTYQDRILKRLVINYKYKFVRELEISLGSILRKYIALLMHQHRFNLFSQSPIITAVPLHSYRQRWRGFNQAEVLAQGLAGTYQMDFLPVLRKIKRTTPQAQLEGRDERLDHWEGVFICTDHGAIRGKDIILIDDICTTGATLDACAEVLKENGAKTVTALVVARG